MQDDQLLSAYLDGELSEHEEMQLQKRLESDPALSRKLKDLCAIDVAVSKSFDSIMDRPLPDRLETTLTQPVLPRTALLKAQLAMAFRRTSVRAVAASVFLAGLLGFGYVVEPFSSVSGEDAGPLAANGAGTLNLNQALDSQPSGETAALDGQPGAQLKVLLSFTDKHGHFCREYLLRQGGGQQHGVACRLQQWQIQISERVNHSGNGEDVQGFVLASGDRASGVGHYIDSVIHGDALGAEQEQELIRNGWVQAEGQ